MIFDDHDVHDDWNISESWLEVAPRGLAASGLFERVRDADDA
jgi:hypothetical protein